ncbi:hypothetical protein CLV51_1011109 [Chitinophaga niastensis]|uniref:Uncharacterized protein n=1 Tax=Chitinophaga niastensis TaxID=536980 RepID=A0A2P8HU83_CHINA|nr:hypothetical protein CLV51_1011109 [Chitinophaga niastensis]
MMITLILLTKIDLKRLAKIKTDITALIFANLFKSKKYNRGNHHNQFNPE